MAKIKSPKIFDPYLGEMYGNILDQYDNPTYNLRLYLKPEESSTVTEPVAAPPAGSPPPIDGDIAGSQEFQGQDARSDQPSTVTAQTRTISDKKIVVLAQTGVTGTQIDELEITHSPANAPFSITAGSFSIIQPGAANFLDQIQWARQYLGTPNEEINSNDVQMYLDINFVGYDSNINDDINASDNNESGGAPVQITDTVTYKIRIQSIDVSLNNSGSRYDIQFTVADIIGFADDIYKLKSTVTVQGSTITELLKSFEDAYNTTLSQNANLFDRADQIKINVDALIGGNDPRTPTAIDTTGASTEKLYITDETIPSAATDQNVVLTTVPIFDGEILTRDQQRRTADGDTVSGPTDSVIPGVTLTVREGTTIYTAVAQVLSMNKEFQSYVSRKKTLDDPGNDEVDNNQTFVAWFDVHCEIETIGWDKKRNKYAKRYIYTPYLIQDARSDVALTTRETEFLSEKGDLLSFEDVPVTAIATKRLQDLYNAGVLHKSYFYLFTGLNDQIINLDIKYDMGITLLMPPKGGFVGEYSVINRSQLRNSLSINEDATGDENLAAADNTKNRESIVDIFNKIKGLADDIKTVADAIGRSPTELAGILSDATGKSARRLAESIDSETVERLARSLGTSDSSDPTDTPTTNTEISVTSSGPYSPEVSGFLYAADFVQPGGALTADEIIAANLLSTSSTTAPASTPPATPSVQSLPSPLSGITSDGPASVMMGYAYRSRENSSFLLTVDLTLRGDPYWLTSRNSGKFEYGQPTPDQTVYPGNGKKNYFILTIGSPRPYDYDVNDEDNNTGYWSEHSTSGVFSGVYFPIEWKTRFSGGTYTVEITANKEITIPLQYIRRVLPGETPPAWDEILKGQDVETILREVGLSNNRLRGGSEGDAGGDGDGPSTYTPVAEGGTGDWANDQPFLNEVDRLSRKYDIDANDLLGLMQNESGMSPSIVNDIGCTGLIQFCPDRPGGSYKTIGGERVELADLKRMNRSEQMRYVEKYLDSVGLPQGANAGQIYAAVFLPGVAQNQNYRGVLARRDNDPNEFYKQNSKLDFNRDGVIDFGDLGQVIRRRRNQLGI